jgi:outer membrane protein TolC
MSAEEYAAEADEQAYSLVEARRATLFEEEGAFSIAPNPDSLRERILRGEVEELTELSLEDCLEIAAENQRDYQTRKESLYLSALDVTLERWRLGWIPDAGADAALAGMGDEAVSSSGSTSLSLSRVLGNGAELVGEIGLSVFKDLLSGDGWGATSNLGLLFTQPLMRGGGKLVTYEPLTQAERDLVYEVRSFERFRRELAVDIAARLLRLLQAVNTIENEEGNYERVREIRMRNEALANAGRLSDFEVGQARQNELSSESRLIDVRQAYQTQLDNFKLFLGLPPGVPISIQQGELQKLVERGLEPASFDEQAVVDTALQLRPDFLTAVDTVVDAERRSRVVANALEMGLDVVSSVQASSTPGKPLEYNFKDVQWGVGVSLDLPVNRLPERNAYRGALITWQRSARNAELFRDEIQIQLRQELRDLQARRESYTIQENAVVLAQQRVDSAQLQQKAGRADTRTLLESQGALVSSQNSQTSALIDYTLARLTLVLDMGLLRVTEDGIQIEPMPTAATVDTPKAPEPTERKNS